METIYVIIKHEEDSRKALQAHLRSVYTRSENNAKKQYFQTHFEDPLCFHSEKEASERIKEEILKDTSNIFSIEKRYVATKDERRKALIP